MVSTTEVYGIDMKSNNYVWALDSLTNNKNKKVSRSDYDYFCKEFVFEKIKGKSFGEAFCERFDFNSTFLRGLSDNFAKDHIETLGYIE